MNTPPKGLERINKYLVSQLTLFSRLSVCHSIITSPPKKKIQLEKHFIKVTFAHIRHIRLRTKPMWQIIKDTWRVPLVIVGYIQPFMPIIIWIRAEQCICFLYASVRWDVCTDCQLLNCLCTCWVEKCMAISKGEEKMCMIRPWLVLTL